MYDQNPLRLPFEYQADTYVEALVAAQARNACPYHLNTTTEGPLRICPICALNTAQITNRARAIADGRRPYLMAHPIEGPLDREAREAAERWTRKPPLDSAWDDDPTWQSVATLAAAALIVAAIVVFIAYA